MEELLKKLDLLKIGEFHFLKELSGGKMAASAVYVNSQEEKVVIKFLILPRNEIELNRFILEAEILLKLGSSDYSKFLVKSLTNIIEVKPYPVYYFIMEYIEGNSLSKEFEIIPPPWPIQKSIQYLFRITCSLSLCAIHGVVHRDLHPGNIMVTRPYISGKKYNEDSELDIRILDFGVSKNWLDVDWQETNFRHIGAHSSWSPESLISPATVGPQHDIWGLGSIFYKMLTGEYAYFTENFGEYFKLVTTGSYNQQKLMDLKIPEVIIFLFNRMFSVDPQKRISNGDLSKICYDYLYNDLSELLDQDEELKRLYYQHDGDVWICPNCENLIHPFGQQCPKCGLLADMFMPFNLLRV